MASLRQIFYLSRAGASLTDQDVRQILRVSQRNNRREDVTGCLLYSGRHFAQVLEGERAAVDTLVKRIASDDRHHGLVVVIDHQVSLRRFPNWSMGILYKLDLVDQLEALLVAQHIPEETALALLSDVNPDTAMGTL